MNLFTHGIMIVQFPMIYNITMKSFSWDKFIPTSSQYPTQCVSTMNSKLQYIPRTRINIHNY